MITLKFLSKSFNPLNEAFFQTGKKPNLPATKIEKCFNPLNEATSQKEHLHFTIDFLGQQGAFLHTPANLAKNKLLLCKLDGLTKIIKRPNR
jgi:hypothetical protein